MKHHLTQFAKLYDYAQKLRSRYLQTLATHKTHERLREIIAPNIAGKKKAKANAEVFNSFLYFFSTTKEATRCYLLIEIAKFFDTSGQSLTIRTALECAEKNIGSYISEVFKEFHKTRNPITLEGYKPFSLTDIKRLKTRIKNNKNRIGRLKTYRDKFLAHDDVKKIHVTITASDVRILMKIIKDSVELLYDKLDYSGTMYQNYEVEPVNEIDRIFSSLHEHRKHEISEMKKKYGIK